METEEVEPPSSSSWRPRSGVPAKKPRVFAPGASLEHESDRSMAEVPAEVVRAEERISEHAGRARGDALR